MKKDLKINYQFTDLVWGMAVFITEITLGQDCVLTDEPMIHTLITRNVLVQVGCECVLSRVILREPSCFLRLYGEFKGVRTLEELGLQE